MTIVEKHINKWNESKLIKSYTDAAGKPDPTNIVMDNRHTKVPRAGVAALVQEEVDASMQDATALAAYDKQRHSKTRSGARSRTPSPRGRKTNRSPSGRMRSS